MDLPELLTPERISCNVRIQSKKRALQTLAELLGASVRESLGMQETAVNGGDEVSDPAKFKAQTLANEAKSKEEKAKKAKSKKNGSVDDEMPDCLSDMDILDALISRERLGATGLGHGVALPHSRLCAIDKPMAAMITLDKGVDFESSDDQAVDLMLGLLVPENCNDEHLKILAKLAKRFSSESLRAELRSFEDPSALFEHIAELPPLE